ncbi:hypothetical protein ANN_00690 [Periplaneta americana]|uniref:Uncharacterized protein n=1 Tax=Periplaneta americana TaxID=6978 RepID=A0ABQ8TRK2_PERAM|nr:hypothetical protein ANN_00690 [Periplaneta americana]
MAGLCEGGNEPLGSLKVNFCLRLCRGLLDLRRLTELRDFLLYFKRVKYCYSDANLPERVENVLIQPHYSEECLSPPKGCGEKVQSSWGKYCNFIVRLRIHMSRGITVMLQSQIHHMDLYDERIIADIIAIDRRNQRSLILEPTVRFEKDDQQANNVNDEKKSIYNPCIPHFSERYKMNINTWEVKGLLFGSRKLHLS